MKLFLISFVLIGICVAGIAIKIWAKKDGEFAGTCASQNPHLNKEGEPCSYCGQDPTTSCSASEEVVKHKKAS